MPLQMIARLLSKSLENFATPCSMGLRFLPHSFFCKCEPFPHRGIPSRNRVVPSVSGAFSGSSRNGICTGRRLPDAVSVRRAADAGKLRISIKNSPGRNKLWFKHVVIPQCCRFGKVRETPSSSPEFARISFLQWNFSTPTLSLCAANKTYFLLRAHEMNLTIRIFVTAIPYPARSFYEYLAIARINVRKRMLRRAGNGAAASFYDPTAEDSELVFDKRSVSFSSPVCAVEGCVIGERELFVKFPLKAFFFVEVNYTICAQDIRNTFPEVFALFGFGNDRLKSDSFLS